MKYLLVTITLGIFLTPHVKAADIDVQIVNSVDKLSCWASGEKLINMCKTFLTSVQDYTSRETSTDQLKAAQDDILIAAQVSIDASFNACQTILNVNAALKLASQNANQVTANL